MQAHDCDYDSDTDSSDGQEHCHLDHHFIITVSTLTSIDELMRTLHGVPASTQSTFGSLDAWLMLSFTWHSIISECAQFCSSSPHPSSILLHGLHLQ